MTSDGKPVQVYLGLGSNTGDSGNILQQAFTELGKYLSSAETSSLYVTEAQDVRQQPDFINAVCCGLFTGNPFDLLSLVNRIEEKFGRDRSSELRRGPRPLDIDILLFGDLVFDKSDSEGRRLTVPHPRLKQRRFALIPMLELDGDLIDPVSGLQYRTISEKLDSAEGQSVIPYRSTGPE